MKIRNPVAKYAGRFNKSAKFKDRRKADKAVRGAKHQARVNQQKSII